MTASARDIIFNHSERVAPLGLIAIPGSEELGRKVNEYLVTWSQEAGYDYDNFLIEAMTFTLLRILAITALNIRFSEE